MLLTMMLVIAVRVLTAVYRTRLSIRGPGSAGGNRTGLCLPQSKVLASTQHPQYQVLQRKTHAQTGIKKTVHHTIDSGKFC